jgi:hypothetical protein
MQSALQKEMGLVSQSGHSDQLPDSCFTYQPIHTAQQVRERGTIYRLLGTWLSTVPTTVQNLQAAGIELV